MKILKYAIVSFVLLASVQAFGQKSVKVGHINTSDLIKALPEFASAQTTLATHGEGLQAQIDILVAEYTKKVEEYQIYIESEAATDIVRKDKEREIIQLEDRIKSFQEEAEKEAALKQQELLNPILEEVEEAIKEVAKEKGYDYILDTSSGIVLYFNESDDVTVFVKKKLGVVEVGTE